MKKSILWSLLGLMVCMLTFSACSKSDDDNNGGSNANTIVGTWYLTDKDGRYIELTFKADGTCTDYEKGTSGKVLTDTGKYTAINDALSVWWDSEIDDKHTEPLTWTYSVSGNKLYISDKGGTYYTRK
jgi:hypothetical protein